MGKITTSVVNGETGLSFNVRLVSKGEKYGRDDMLEYEDKEPIVEFYDARYTEGFGDLGQFVSSYYARTIQKHNTHLNLDMGVKDWWVTESNIKEVHDWLKGYL